MKCENCAHECSIVDFSTLRNLCEHLYLDALAKKRQRFLTLPRIENHRKESVQQLVLS